MAAANRSSTCTRRSNDPGRPTSAATTASPPTAGRPPLQTLLRFAVRANAGRHPLQNLPVRCHTRRHIFKHEDI